MSNLKWQDELHRKKKPENFKKWTKRHCTLKIEKIIKAIILTVCPKTLGLHVQQWV